MLQITFRLSITRVESFLPKGRCMTPDVTKTFLLPIIKGSFTNIISSGWLQMLKIIFLQPISKGRLTHSNSSAWLQMLQTIFSCPSARGESCPLTLKCMTTDFANDFSPAHQQGGSPTQPNSSAGLQMMQMTFLLPISKGGVLPT